MFPAPLLSSPVANTYQFSPPPPTTSPGSCAARSPLSRHGSSACAGAGGAASAGGATAPVSPITAATTVRSGASRTASSVLREGQVARDDPASKIVERRRSAYARQGGEQRSDTRGITRE